MSPKYSSITLTALVAVIALALSTTAASGTPAPTAAVAKAGEQTLRFDQRVTFNSLSENLISVRSNTQVVFVEQIPGGQQLTTGVVIPVGGQARPLALAALNASHLGLTSRSAEETLASGTVDRLTTTDIALAEAATSLGAVRFDALSALGDQAAAVTTAGGPGVTPQSGDLGVCGASFQPSSTGYATYNFSDTRQRRLDVTFKWSTAYLANLKACGANITYEHEVREYNYGGTHYFTSMTASWSSTMPNAYLDTPVSDSSSEVSHTIGTWDARGLVAGTTYRNTVVTGTGNANSGTGKIQGQRGHRSPSSCSSTYCIFADQTLSIVPAWTLVFPKSGAV